MDSQNRQDYAELGLPIVATFQMAHPLGPFALRDLCIERIRVRGDAHRTLTPAAFSRGGKQNPFDGIARIVSGFVKPLPRYLTADDKEESLVWFRW